jgi:hypothetical protein
VEPKSLSSDTPNSNKSEAGKSLRYGRALHWVAWRCM